MDKAQLKKLIKKYQNGTASPAEQFIVDYWYDTLGKSEFDTSETDSIPDRADLKSRILFGAKQKSKHIIHMRYYKMAAASIILGVLSFLFLRDESKPIINPLSASIKTVQLEKGTLTTSTAERTTVVLMDGSKVTLNAHSSLSVTDFEKKREVVLIGEAFFEVKKDVNRPFTVHGGGLDIQVLGTSFNVQAYKGSQNTSVSVRTGKVRIANQNSNLSTLIADENIKYDRRSTAFKLIKAHFPLETSWLSDVVTLDQVSFEELSQTFYNFYGMTLVTEDKKVASDLYNIAFRTSTSMEQMLEDIKLLTGKKSITKNKEGNSKIILY